MGKLGDMVDSGRSALGAMSASQKLLIGSLAVIALMAMFLVTQYTARPDMVGLMVDDPNSDLVDTLRIGGIDAQLVNGEVVVPKGQRRRAVAQLHEAGELPGDTSVLFRNLVEVQDWKASKEQNRQAYRLALQNELGRIIAQFADVASANVIIDAPEPSGLGRAVRPPSASVTVFTSTGSPMTQSTVDGVARLVAGAQSGLAVQKVQVIDGTTGRARRATEPDDMIATTYLDHAGKVERAFVEKFEKQLAHIPGVVVTVTARVDVTHVRSQTERALPKGDGSEALLLSTSEGSEASQSATRGAEPGVRSNQQADINIGSSGNGTSFEASDGTSDFVVLPGTERRDVVDPRGMPTSLAATVNVPRNYVVGLIEQARAPAEDGADAEAPTDTEVQARFDEVRRELEQVLQPHLTSVGPAGEAIAGRVYVMMMSSVPGAGRAGMPSSAGGLFASIAGGSGGGGVFGGGLIDAVLVGGLALVSLVMLFMLVRKSGKRPELPSAEDLVGIPPTLEDEMDLVGEADESDAPMEGIEIFDDEMESRQLLEQVGELIENDPRAAAKHVSRWLSLAG